MVKSTKFSAWKIILPTLLGMGVIVYMLWKDLAQDGGENLESLKQIQVSWRTFFWIFVALLLMVGRDLGFTIRYRYLTDKLLSWKQSIKVTLLAEFGSAITPSTVGGSSMAVLFLAKENISVGKSTTMVFVTMLLDEMFFVVTFPVLFLFLPFDSLFSSDSALEVSIFTLFVVAYIIKLLLCACLITGLFFKPQAIRWLLLNIFRLPFLRKWQRAAQKVGDDIILSSKEIKGKKISYWLPLIFATVLSWCSRYLVVNALFMAFFPVEDNLLVFARQFVMWILMIISITPGGSGLTEIIFDKYLSGLIPIMGLAPVIMLLWRLLSYYNYLFIGALLVPRWISSSFGKRSQ
ncbi:lysylphosphatidylglycerol synthase transmembrane domain-containing protein [Dysgonomonas sp. 216]|uniref:lysylphosphatidylglycerol synthase transmembrane domain-containing protein n=1 Tax=Dysgonomonas sp. 216 TaxID=2302934 RepID=UPI001C8846CD|nr:lysylphosphatidylglycerol synthase transmembrane domain-containing protein [Dysgonomonas sp. 216]